MPGLTVRPPEARPSRPTLEPPPSRILRAFPGNRGCLSDVQTDVSTQLFKRPIQTKTPLPEHPARLRDPKAPHARQAREVPS